MKLDTPLSTLIEQCQTICVNECCGVDAYDFSPIHMASYLVCYWAGKIDEEQISKIEEQLRELNMNYGLSGSVSIGVSIPEMNQNFSGNGIRELTNLIQSNLDVAVQLVKNYEPQNLKMK